MAFGLLFASSAWPLVTFSVDSDMDQVDDNTVDGVCHTAAGTCTLRAAVMQANHIVNDDSEIVLPAGFYALGPATNTDGEDSGDLNLIAPVSGNPVITISGAGSANTTIWGSFTDRVLTVAAGRTAVVASVDITAGSSAGPGGGILNHGVLTLTQVSLDSNQSQGCGGGAYNTNQLGIYSSTVSQNLAVGNSGLGAGVCNEAGAGLTIVRSTIESNDAHLAGGIANLGVSVLINSTLSRNSSLTDGGGIHNRGVINVYSSTIVDNWANTFSVAYTGGGIFNAPGSTFNLRNTIVAGNTAGASVYNDCAGTLSSYGRNRFWVVSDCTVNQVGPGGPGLLVSLAELGSLRDNGGPTRTFALVPPSDMIDGAEPTVGCVDQNGALLTTDQRGRPRSIGARCDIGAFEYDPDEIFLDGFQ